jgi:hypothetical protein
MSKLDQLKALGDAKRAARKSSDGGGKSIAAKTGNKAGSIPAEAGCSAATSIERKDVRGAAIQPCAGVAPGPSDAKRGRGRPRITGQRPWESEGISKRTYYRRQEEKRAKEERK